MKPPRAAASSAPEVTSQSKVQLRRLARVMRLIMNEHGAVNCALLHTFVHVALQPGDGIGEYSQRSGTPNSSMSLQLMNLTNLKRDKRLGLGLVKTETDKDTLRRKVVTLTSKGVSIADEIAAILRGAYDREDNGDARLSRKA